MYLWNRLQYYSFMVYARLVFSLVRIAVEKSTRTTTPGRIAALENALQHFAVYSACLILRSMKLTNRRLTLPSSPRQIE